MRVTTRTSLILFFTFIFFEVLAFMPNKNVSLLLQSSYQELPCIKCGFGSIVNGQSALSSLGRDNNNHAPVQQHPFFLKNNGIDLSNKKLEQPQKGSSQNASYDPPKYSPHDDDIVKQWFNRKENAQDDVIAAAEKAILGKEQRKREIDRIQIRKLIEDTVKETVQKELVVGQQQLESDKLKMEEAWKDIWEKKKELSQQQQELEREKKALDDLRKSIESNINGVKGEEDQQTIGKGGRDSIEKDALTMELNGSKPAGIEHNSSQDNEEWNMAMFEAKILDDDDANDESCSDDNKELLEAVKGAAIDMSRALLSELRASAADILTASLPSERQHDLVNHWKERTEQNERKQIPRKMEIEAKQSGSPSTQAKPEMQQQPLMQQKENQHQSLQQEENQQQPWQQQDNQQHLMQQHENSLTRCENQQQPWQKHENQHQLFQQEENQRQLWQHQEDPQQLSQEQEIRQNPLQQQEEQQVIQQDESQRQSLTQRENQQQPWQEHENQQQPWHQQEAQRQPRQQEENQPLMQQQEIQQQHNKMQQYQQHKQEKKWEEEYLEFQSQHESQEHQQQSRYHPWQQEGQEGGTEMRVMEEMQKCQQDPKQQEEQHKQEQQQRKKGRLIGLQITAEVQQQQTQQQEQDKELLRAAIELHEKGEEELEALAQAIDDVKYQVKIMEAKLKMKEINNRAFLMENNYDERKRNELIKDQKLMDEFMKEKEKLDHLTALQKKREEEQAELKAVEEAFRRKMCQKY